MHFSRSLSILAALATANGLNILVTNDDGFETGFIRKMYKAVKANGHNVYIVASTTDRSGSGGTLSFSTTANLTADSEFGTVKKGAPSIGVDPNDNHIWYYDGTPSSCVQVALDYILPKFANFTTPDLVMSGPNYGNNLGDLTYIGSGTVGAAYYAIGRGIPAIAISAGNTGATAYYSVNSTTAAGLKDPATIIGALCANLAQQLIKSSKGGRLLPVGYGITVNIPTITSQVSGVCVDPPFIQTRLTGGAYNVGAAYNASTGLFSFKILPDFPALNLCINGDCSLPGESVIVAKGCESAVSVFDIDTDASSPMLASCSGPTDVAVTIRANLTPLVQYMNTTSLVGGPNTTTTGNASSTSVATTIPTLSSTVAVATGSGVVVSISGLETFLTAVFLVESILL